MSRIRDVKRSHGRAESPRRRKCHEDPLKERTIFVVGLRERVAVREKRRIELNPVIDDSRFTMPSIPAAKP